MPKTAKSKPVRYRTPPVVAAEFGVTTKKVIEWILAGELEALNLARRGCHRPRYAIPPESLEKFKRSRLVVPEAKPARRRRSSAGAKDFFPD